MKNIINFSFVLILFAYRYCLTLTLQVIFKKKKKKTHAKIGLKHWKQAILTLQNTLVQEFSSNQRTLTSKYTIHWSKMALTVFLQYSFSIGSVNEIFIRGLCKILYCRKISLLE